MSSCGAISVGNCSFRIELKSKVARLNTELVKQRSRASNYKRHHERSKLPEAKVQPQKLKTELANELKLLAKAKRLNSLLATMGADGVRSPLWRSGKESKKLKEQVEELNERNRRFTEQVVETLS